MSKTTLTPRGELVLGVFAFLSIIATMVIATLVLAMYLSIPVVR